MGKYEEDNSLYNDGEDRKPKLLILLGAIIIIVIILVLVISCGMKTKSSNNYLSYLKVNNQEKVNAIAHQEELISKYLPKMLSEDEIRKEIDSLEDKSIPSIMKHFKANFQGKVDMSLVNKIAKSI